jgi:hypothetical protein
MPHFSLQTSPHGPIVRSAIMVSNSRQQMLTDLQQAIPDPQTIDALIDTGASISGVDPTVLTALGLSPTGEAEVLSTTSGAAGVSVPTYDVCIGIYALRQGDLHFISGTVQVTATDLGSRSFKALIGTDVLSKCILHYNGADGFFTLAY